MASISAQGASAVTGRDSSFGRTAAFVSACDRDPRGARPVGTGGAHARDAATPWRATHAPTDTLAKRCRADLTGGDRRGILLAHRRAYRRPSCALFRAGRGGRVCRAHAWSAAASSDRVIGVALGIGIGDPLISAIGTGPWQIGLVAALAMSVAVLRDGGAVITVQSAISAILMATLYLPGDSGELGRLVDPWRHEGGRRCRDKPRF